MILWVCSKWNEKPTDDEKIQVTARAGSDVYESVDGTTKEGLWLYLPQSHYRPCEPPAPPERWEDITAECNVDRDGDLVHGESVPPGRLLTQDCWPLEGYRLRKVQVPNHGSGMSSYFVVEKKVTT